ncbi:MAG: hypothetical protein JXB20_02310 [Bacilli bacterium]|nr:hypothetical protein [Bacilli bacterium]MBN2695943.1 hypothetical protein [Bacilli bacterium]
MIEYIRKTADDKLIVLSDQQQDIYDEPLSRYLSKLALARLSTLEGRIKACKKLFHFASRPPLFFGADMLFLQLIGIRSNKALLVNYHAITAYRKAKMGIVIEFSGRYEIYFRSSVVFMSELAKAAQVISYLQRLE